MEELRKVLYVEPGGGYKPHKAFTSEGYLHMLTTKAGTTDTENGMMQYQYVVAVVETADGRLLELSTDSIKFVQPYGAPSALATKEIPRN